MYAASNDQEENELRVTSAGFFSQEVYSVISLNASGELSE